jgi:acyl-CoA synthetase (AMP-forming)/AMP-acid ligase II/pyrroloquinoline quinone (PQQ) biosynthesis protein C
MNGLLAALEAHRPNRIAIDGITEAALDYAQLASRVRQMASDLAHLHSPVQPVAVRLDHGSALALLDLGLMVAGIPQLSLPAFFTDDQTLTAITSSGAQALYDGSQLMTVTTRPSTPADRLPCATARITFTSGSTDRPKGICLSAEHMMTVARSVVEKVGANHAGRHLALLPPGILLETIAGFYATMLAGGTYVCPPQALTGLANPFRPDFALMARKISEWRITSLILVPEYLAGLVGALEASGRRLPELTLVAVGGARTPPALIERASALGLPVRQGYGLTECGSVVSLADANDSEPGSVGTVLPHMRPEIAADGEILLHGPICLGVPGSPRPSVPLGTGDLGRLDSEGRLFIEGRKSSLIISSFARNISPEWLEETLLAQGGLVQAMVYGDGLAAPEALLVPAHPGADLAAVVAAANVVLPEYARIARWRPAAPFTPMNGHLTGNGRLRREKIMATYGTGTTPFFTVIEQRTAFALRAFLSVPQVQAGLMGEISLAAYLAYLTQAYHHVRHTVPLMQEARARMMHRSAMVAALDEYVDEETGHEEWILNDIAAAGGDAMAARNSQPAPATRAMVDHAYDRIRNGNPVGFFGMVFVLESISVAMASRGASSIAVRLGLPPEAFTYLTSHGALDQEHMRFFADMVNAIDDPEDQEAIAMMAEEIFPLFGGIFATISLELDDVAA